jgi:hypothetical protein
MFVGVAAAVAAGSTNKNQHPNDDAAAYVAYVFVETATVNVRSFE